jgi:transposase
MRRTFSAEFKAKVAREALRGEDPIQAIAARHELLLVQVSQWKKEARKQIEEITKQKELYARIGQQQIEIDFLKKLSPCPEVYPENWTAPAGASFVGGRGESLGPCRALHLRQSRQSGNGHPCRRR